MSAEVNSAKPAAESTLEVLHAQRVAWETRPLVRYLYRSWFAEMQQHLAQLDAPTMELGCGSGAFKDFMPKVIATDIIESPWVDRVIDAQELPFETGSLANVVMVDVFHHLPHPAHALREIERVLAPAGRVVMLEPYCSPVSRLVYRYLHHESADMSADPEQSAPQSSSDPFDANNALPTLIFWRRPELIARWVPNLRVVGRRRLAWLVYPLSGGFSKPRLVPTALVGPALGLERVLDSVLAPLFAFRCLVVLERI